MMLSGALMFTDPERALAAAEECISLDQTHRKAWSTLCAGPAATLRFERGEIHAGLVIWRDFLRQLHWAGEVFHISLMLPALANSVALIDPDLAIDVTAIGGALMGYAVFEGLAGYERTKRVVDDVGADAVQAASTRAESMTYDESMQFVFDAIDRLLAEAG
jgi:hypothetical protein